MIKNFTLLIAILFSLNAFSDECRLDIHNNDYIELEDLTEISDSNLPTYKLTLGITKIIRTNGSYTYRDSNNHNKETFTIQLDSEHIDDGGFSKRQYFTILNSSPSERIYPDNYTNDEIEKNR